MSVRSEHADFGGVDIVCRKLYTGANYPEDLGTELTSSNLGLLTGVTAGTALASKVLTVDAAYGAYGTRVVPVEQRITLTATADLGDSSIASATAFFAATGATTGAVTLAAGIAYQFEQFMWWTNTGTASHTWSALYGGTATFTRIMVHHVGSTSTGAALTATSGISKAAATAAVITGASTSATENVVFRSHGIMTVNAGGTVIPQILASAQPGATGTPGVTAQPGSYFRIWPIGAAATIVVGSWS